jgi:DNA-directed RNA polymerase alpha subunit
VAYAAELGQAHLGYLLSFGSGTNGAEPKRREHKDGKRAVPADMAELLDSELAEFEGISIRSRNNLDKADIHTLYDIVVRTRDEILDVPSFGEKSLEEVAEVVALNGLRFGMNLERGDEGDLWIVEEEAASDEESDEA